VTSRDRQPVNLLEMKPRRNVKWETGEGGRTVLLVPKFRNRMLRAWLLPLLAKPDFRVKLDATGTAFWQRCDGSTTVLEIADEMATCSGSDVDEMLERLSRFLARLEHEEFIVLSGGGTGGRQDVCDEIK
jgi:hypothetical protein